MMSMISNLLAHEAARQTAHSELETQEEDILLLAKALVVNSQESYDIAAQFALAHANPLIKTIAGDLGPAVTATNTAHKLAVALLNKHLGPLTEAKKIAVAKCDAYKAEQLRIQHKAEQEASIEAQKIADETRIQDAVAAEQSNEPPEIVAAILDEPALPQPVAPLAAPFKQATHIHRAKILTAEVTSLRALIEHAAKNPQYVGYLQANQTALNQAARSQRERFKVPGVRLIS